ncbi:hypothetical protein KC19_10G124100 [Ceratodon purpureus]|uniref:Uncharacterized protein n=1 Tax=Ceratodon purpureus TaxID=3225 RepID=A0A8T0GM97_CERPU|nr:hypothetical protein KC19_10G124100 [Ceratodon purpureus]
MEVLKGILKFRKHPPTSPLVETDFLKLCQQNVNSIQTLVRSGNLLNERQCQDLLLKLFRTFHSVQELLLHCGGSTDLFRRALENLYLIFEKARILVNMCCIEDDWITKAVFQIENAKTFQEILLEVGLCYHAIYEQAKGVSDARNFQQFEDLRQSSTFKPAPVTDIDLDQVALKQKLEGLVSGNLNSPKGSDRDQNREECLARYLLMTWDCISQQYQNKEFDLSSAILCMKEIEMTTKTWGKDKFIGSGGFGGVCKTKWLGISCAKKVFHGEVIESLFLKEAGILLRLNHPNIVRFFCCGSGAEGGDYFIAMELMEMNLATLISTQSRGQTPFPYPVAVDIIVQIARAMCYLHAMGVVHRDLKPQNVVVNKLTSRHLPDYYQVKLVDFGLSKATVEVSKSNTMTGPGIGTTRYRAPEAHPDGPGRVNWFKADVYSFGCTCAHLLSLKEPFENMRLGNMYVELMNGLKPEVPATCPEKLVALLNDCWDTSPNSRPGFPEICMKLEGIRHTLMRGSSPHNEGFKEELEPASNEFIQIALEEHFATWKKHISSTDGVIDLQPALDPDRIMSVNQHEPCNHRGEDINFTWDDIKAGPLLFLEEPVTGNSRDENLLESKHSLLLSQNGARNGFVEQLYLEEGGGIMATQGGGTPPSSPDEFPAGMRVLVVDDDPICLMVLKRMLQRCNYRVTTCGKGADALSLLREDINKFDLVISDANMPDMDGFKLLELVNGLEMDVPIIMMSGNGETSAVMKGVTHGACDYLLKPVRMEEMRNIWQHVVRKKR